MRALSVCAMWEGVCLRRGARGVCMIHMCIHATMYYMHAYQLILLILPLWNSPIHRITL